MQALFEPTHCTGGTLEGGLEWERSGTLTMVGYETIQRKRVHRNPHVVWPRDEGEAGDSIRAEILARDSLYHIII